MNQGFERDSDDQDKSLIDFHQKVLGRCSQSLILGGFCLSIVAETESDYTTLLDGAIYDVAKEADRQRARSVRISIKGNGHVPRILMVSTLLQLHQVELERRDQSFTDESHYPPHSREDGSVRRDLGLGKPTP